MPSRKENREQTLEKSMALAKQHLDNATEHAEKRDWIETMKALDRCKQDLLSARLQCYNLSNNQRSSNKCEKD